MIGKPELSRSNRTYENLYINGRYIKSDLVKNAAEDAYKTRIMIGKFPVYIMNLILPPYEYDINVHPAKLEVRFKREEDIYNLVNIGITELLQSQKLIPKVLIDTCKTEKHKPIIAQEKIKIDEMEYENIDTSKKEISGIVKESSENFYDIIKYNTENNNIIESKNFLNNYRIVGQIFSTYWIIEQNDSMYIIDQHAAHEKILYEQFVKTYKNNKHISQILLQPLTVRVSIKEKEVLTENLSIFENLGFHIEEFGKNTYIVRSVPIIFNNPENTDFFIEILDFLNDSVNSNFDIKFTKIVSMSCKAAVKAHDKLNTLEINKLIEDLLNLENPFNCPHGRPTIIEISKNEIEKKFKRT